MSMIVTKPTPIVGAKVGDNLTILASIPREAVQFTKSVMVDGQELFPKDELHLTLIGFKEAKILREAAKKDPALRQRMEEAASKVVATVIDWLDVYVIRQPEAGKITLAVPAMLLEAGELGKVVGEYGVELCFPHVTIYTLRPPPEDPKRMMGIGISRQSDWDKLAAPFRP